MNPSVQNRLDSCVRALEHVVLPALPDSASLAREQVMLVMGQVQIIRAQLDAAPAFEQAEAEDLASLARAICVEAGTRGDKLCALVDSAPSDVPRERTAAIQDAIEALLRSYDDDGGAPAAIAQIICDHGAKRARKDREWFAAMGFDAGFVPGAKA